MLERRGRDEAATIVQKFIKGSPGEIPPVPLLLGISATPERFTSCSTARSGRHARASTVDPEDVRASGLLKETIVLYHPSEKQPSDVSLLARRGRAAEALPRASGTTYSDEGRRADASTRCSSSRSRTRRDGKVTKTDLDEALGVDRGRARAARRRRDRALRSRRARRSRSASARSATSRRPTSRTTTNLRVVFFKRSLNTGWDCPRAEVMMCFRRAVDYTLIAQLVGRMVRTPLARARPARTSS